MIHATLLPLALIAFMLVAKPLCGAEVLIDGVPLPDDARLAAAVETDPVEIRQWVGVWVGALGVAT